MHSHTQDCESVQEKSEEHKLEDTPKGIYEESRKKVNKKLKTSFSRKKEYEHMRTSHNVKNKQESILKNSFSGIPLRTSHDDRINTKKTSFADEYDNNSLNMAQ